MAARKKTVTVRSALVDGLRPLLPRGWKLVPYRTTTDDINQVTVWVKLETIGKLTEAPASGYLLVTFTVTVASTKASFTEADRDLDGRVIDLFDAIDSLPMIRRAEAKAVAVSDTHLGYDITVELVTQPTKE